MNFIYGYDLEQYFLPQHLEFLGSVSRDYYTQYKAVPEGWYKICVSGWDYMVRDQQVANENCQVVYLSKSAPPILSLPLKGDRVTSNSGQNILFTWIPQNVSSPNSAYNTDYILELWEIPKVGINRDAEFISNTLKPYASISVSDQYNYIYTIMDPILKDGYKYSWRVTAKDRSGRDYFQNGGKSNINTFEFIDITLHPNALMAPKVKICEIRCEEDYYSAVVKWRKQAVYTKYKVYYTTAENTGSKRLYEEITEGDSLEITKLGTNTQWEYWVNGLTSDSLEGPECEHRLFTTKNYAKAFGCDVEPPKHPKPKGYKKEYAKIPRIKVLEAGEEIELKVGVLKIFSATRDSDSSYSGDCAHTNPFGLRGFINCRYRKLKVNEYNQMITGEIVFKSDLDGKFNKMQELTTAKKQLDSVRSIAKEYQKKLNIIQKKLDSIGDLTLNEIQESYNDMNVFATEAKKTIEVLKADTTKADKETNEVKIKELEEAVKDAENCNNCLVEHIKDKRKGEQNYTPVSGPNINWFSYEDTKCNIKEALITGNEAYKKGGAEEGTKEQKSDVYPNWIGIKKDGKIIKYPDYNADRGDIIEDEPSNKKNKIHLPFDEWKDEKYFLGLATHNDNIYRLVKIDNKEVWIHSIVYNLKGILNLTLAEKEFKYLVGKDTNTIGWYKFKPVGYNPKDILLYYKEMGLVADLLLQVYGQSLLYLITPALSGGLLKIFGNMISPILIKSGVSVAISLSAEIISNKGKIEEIDWISVSLDLFPNEKIIVSLGKNLLDAMFDYSMKDEWKIVFAKGENEKNKYVALEQFIASSVVEKVFGKLNKEIKDNLIKNKIKKDVATQYSIKIVETQRELVKSTLKGVINNKIKELNDNK